MPIMAKDVSICKEGFTLDIPWWGRCIFSVGSLMDLADRTSKDRIIIKILVIVISSVNVTVADMAQKVYWHFVVLITTGWRTHGNNSRQ